MWAAACAITTLGLVLIGFGVLVGRLRIEDALVRIGGLLMLLILAPWVAGAMHAALGALLKPALLLLALVVIVTVFVRVLVSLFS